MKKILLLVLLFIGISTLSYSQSAGKGSAESSSGSSRRKIRRQKSHFDQKKKDPNMKHNGTSFNTRNRRSQKNKVDADGFGAMGVDKRKKTRKNGLQ
ncbi:MAG: hypothetical protein ABI315_04535 [Bacteroidia bacterium]